MADAKISALPSATTPLAGTEVLPVVQGGTTDKVSVANLTAGRAVAAGSLSINGAGTGANLNTKPTTYGLGTAVVPSLVMESNASGGTATNPSSHGAVIWGTVASPMGTINLVQTNPSASSRNYLSISTTANGTYQETFRIADLGDISVPIGNIIPGTAAKGVNFTANTPAAGMTSQLLNWYEEGTWTPTAAGGTTAGTATYSIQVGRYTRIGNRVFFSCRIEYTGGTGTGVMRINGLPYTSASISNYLDVCSIMVSDLALSANNYAVAYVFNGSNFISIDQNVVGGGASTNVTYDSAASIFVSGSYTV